MWRARNLNLFSKLYSISLFFQNRALGKKNFSLWQGCLCVKLISNNSTTFENSISEKSDRQGEPAIISGRSLYLGLGHQRKCVTFIYVTYWCKVFNNIVLLLLWDVITCTELSTRLKMTTFCMIFKREREKYSLYLVGMEVICVENVLFPSFHLNRVINLHGFPAVTAVINKRHTDSPSGWVCLKL